MLTLLAFLMTGIAQILSNLPSYFPRGDQIDSSWRSLFFALGLGGGMIARTLPARRDRRNELLKMLLKREIWKYGLLLGITDIAAALFFLYRGMDCLAKAGVGAIAYPIAVVSSIVFFELYSRLILREKRTWLQLSALILLIVGSAILTV